MKPIDKYTHTMSAVIGNKLSGERVRFTITPYEVKHIRRCLSLYERIHPALEGDNKMARRLITKFMRFGNINSEMNKRTRAYVYKNKENKCKYCGATEKLTIHHIIPKCNGGGLTLENLDIVCKKCHMIHNYKEVLERKKIEIIKLEEKIKELEALPP